MNTREVLLKAAELIEQRGYRQIGKSGAGLSMWTSVYDCGPKQSGAIFDLLDVVLDDGRDTKMYGYRPWARWEKHPSRTPEEVIDALIAAAYWDQP